MLKKHRTYLLSLLLAMIWGNTDLNSQCSIQLVDQWYIQSGSTVTLDVQGLPNYQPAYDWSFQTNLSEIQVVSEGLDFIELAVEETALSNVTQLYYSYQDVNCVVLDTVEVFILGTNLFQLEDFGSIICEDELGEELGLDCNCNIDGLGFNLLDSDGNILASNINALPGTLSPGGYSIQVSWNNLDFGCTNCLISDLGFLNFPFQLSSSESPVLVCNDQVNVSLDAGCGFELHPDNLVELLSEEEMLELDIALYAGNALVDQLGAEHIGMTLNYTLSHPCGGNSCSGNIMVEDKIAPVFDQTNIDLIKICGDSTLADTPVAYDNCGQAVQVNLISSSVQDFDCLANGGLIKVETRVYNAVDDQGNISESFTQTVSTRLPLLSEIQFPAHLNDVDAASLNCQESALTDPAFTGYPSAFGLDLVPGQEYCGLVLIYDDQVLAGCGESFTILRNWKIFRTCSSNTETVEHLQFIQVKDKLDPYIDCPEYLEISVDDDCGLENWTPQFFVEDDCSSLSWTLSGDDWFIHEGESVDYIEIGTHNIELIASDECGNSSNCSIELHLLDAQSPTAICLEFFDVSLDNEGKAIIEYNSIDNGSYDNCSAELDYRLRIMGGLYQQQVQFDCNDILLSPLNLEMQVEDEAGNKSSCMVEVQLTDKINPLITCPETLSVDCSAIDTWNDLWEDPIYTDNCEISSISLEVDSSQLETVCYTGTISRLVQVTDASGNSASCTQYMEWIGTEALQESLISWPADILLDGCSGEFDPDSLLLDGSRPVIDYALCGILAVNYSDQIFYTGGEECFKIIRSWSVLDWCHYDEELNLGLFESQQEIAVIDNDAPVVDCNIVPFVKLDSPDCFGEITLELPYIIEECSDQIDIEVNSIFGQGIGPFTDVGLGTYEVTYYISDACGNTTTCVVDLMVSDAKVPTAYCVDELVIDMPVEGEVSIAAEDFDFASFDNCTQDEELRFSFSVFPWDSVQVFDCLNVGLNEVSMYVFDAENNFDFCNVTLHIQDNFNHCMLSTPSLAGAVTDLNGIGFEGVDVQVSGGTSISAFTDNNGTYLIEDLSIGADYTIAPQYLTTNDLEGVTTYDLVLISQHILGILPFDSPYQWIAADVNDSGSITTLDIVAIRKMILQIDDVFPNGKSWKFIDADFDFPLGMNPLLSGYSEILNVNNLEDALSNLNFLAIKLGDVNP